MLDIRETKIQGWKEKYQLEIFMLQLSNQNKKKKVIVDNGGKTFKESILSMSRYSKVENQNLIKKWSKIAYLSHTNFVTYDKLHILQMQGNRNVMSNKIILYCRTYSKTVESSKTCDRL